MWDECLQEVGHFLAAFPKKVKLSIPFFIPNITLGSFGAITQVNLSDSDSRLWNELEKPYAYFYFQVWMHCSYQVFLFSDFDLQ